MKRLGRPMLATSAISSLSLTRKITGSKLNPRSRASPSIRSMTGRYASTTPLPARPDRAHELARGLPNGIHVHQVGEQRIGGAPCGLLDELRESPHAAPAGIDVPVGDQVEAPQSLLEPPFGQVEVAGAGLAVGEQEQELVV